MKEKDTKVKIEELKETGKNKLTKQFPALYWESFVMVDSPNIRLAIDDVSYKTTIPIDSDIELLQMSCRGWLEVYDANGLTNALGNKLERLFSAVNRRKTVLVFPGTGSRIVKDLLPNSLIEGIGIIELPTQRKVGRNGSVEGIELGEKTTLRQEIADRKAETVIVVDDVITTGSTLTAIRDAFPMRNIEWFGASFMMLSPLQRRNEKSDAGIEGYKAIISPIVYQGLTGIPPLNSISTLVGQSEKSLAVRDRYIQNFAEDKEGFQTAMRQIQNKLKGEI